MKGSMMSSDMWDKIHTQLPRAMDMVEEAVIPEVFNTTWLYKELEERYRRGEQEHGGEWLNWKPMAFVDNIREEVYDMILYCAMNLARKEEARKYGDISLSYNEAKLLSCEEKQTETESAA